MSNKRKNILRHFNYIELLSNVEKLKKKQQQIDTNKFILLKNEKYSIKSHELLKKRNFSAWILKFMKLVIFFKKRMIQQLRLLYPKVTFKENKICINIFILKKS